MAADEVADFERRTFRDWNPASLGDLRHAIERRRREFGRLSRKTRLLALFDTTSSPSAQAPKS